MGSGATERKLAAILSADAVGYSRLMADAEEETVAVLKSHRALMETLIRQHGGRVVDDPGDNLLSEFPSVVDAVACAVAIQKGLAGRNAQLPEGRRMPYRVGVNLGDVIVDGGRLYGDGVNIAARVEGLAEPGSVAISGTAFDHVDGKLGLAFEDRGEHAVKNLPRPVRVYRVRVTDAHERVSQQSVAGFSGRPAIAVLAFDNLSGDPEQEYFADGIAEDLITRLSAWRWFPVIARNSSFVYKGAPVDVKRVSRELGVRYVVEGSVRKAGSRVRITAQLIDATTGHHVWSERYDRELRDVFGLQDEITEAIVASMSPELRQFETERIARREPRNLDAWECAQRGWWQMFQPGADRNAKARALYERSIELDPQCVWAHYGLAMTHYNDVIDLTTGSRESSVDQMLRAGRRCIELDPQDPLGHVAFGAAAGLAGDRRGMYAALERAIELNPSLATAHYWLGVVRAWGGRAEEAIASLEKAMRLNPKDPMGWISLHGVAMAHFAAGRYAEAVEWARRSLQHRVGSVANSILAASLARLGRTEEARGALARFYGRRPRPTLSDLRQIIVFADPDVAERYLGALRDAGLAE